MPIPTGRCPRPCTTRCSASWRSSASSFAETVAAGRGDRLSQNAALATEAAVFRGADAIAAGLADELADPVTVLPRVCRGAARGTNPTSRKGPQMTTNSTDTAIPLNCRCDTTRHEQPRQPRLRQRHRCPGRQAAMTADAIRAEAAEVAQVCAQAARLGVDIDAADAVARGLKPDALRSRVLTDLAARSDAAGIIPTAPAAAADERQPNHRRREEGCFNLALNPPSKTHGD